MRPFNSRATTAISALHLIHWIWNQQVSFDKTKEVISNNIDVAEDDWQLHHGCGCSIWLRNDECWMQSYITSVLHEYGGVLRRPCRPLQHAYGCFPYQDWELFGNLSRLIKRSSYDEKIFKPIIMTLVLPEMVVMEFMRCPTTFRPSQRIMGWHYGTSCM